MKKCADCKFLDRTRSIYWRGMFGNFYVCKKREAEQQAANNRDMTQRPIFELPRHGRQPTRRYVLRGGIGRGKGSI